MSANDIKPNHTIYINNLNEKIKKEGEFIFVNAFLEITNFDILIFKFSQS